MHGGFVEPAGAIPLFLQRPQAGLDLRPEKKGPGDAARRLSSAISFGEGFGSRRPNSFPLGSRTITGPNDSATIRAWSSVKITSGMATPPSFLLMYHAARLSTPQCPTYFAYSVRARSTSLVPLMMARPSGKTVNSQLSALNFKRKRL